MSFLTVLPLAFVMIAGPRSSRPPATTRGATPSPSYRGSPGRHRRDHGRLLGDSQLERAAGPSGQGTVKTVIDWLILVLFLFLMVRTYRRRKDTTTPKWMGRIQTADVGFSFRLGLLLFLAMPTDILMMFTVGASLTRHGQPWWHGLPFVLVTPTPASPSPTSASP